MDDIGTRAFFFVALIVGNIQCKIIGLLFQTHLQTLRKHGGLPILVAPLPIMGIQSLPQIVVGCIGKQTQPPPLKIGQGLCTQVSLWRAKTNYHSVLEKAHLTQAGFQSPGTGAKVPTGTVSLVGSKKEVSRWGIANRSQLLCVGGMEDRVSE